MAETVQADPFDHLGPEIKRDDEKQLEVGAVMPAGGITGRLGTWVGVGNDENGKTIWQLEQLPPEEKEEERDE